MASTRPDVPEFRESNAYKTDQTAKRVLDLTLAIAGIVFCCPLMVLIGIATWLDGGRPIFFSQPRLGRGGRVFHLYKFRKFYEGRRLGGRPVTVKNDPRLTRVGKLLVRTKLDELPQLWNVIAGDMSIVGPRPETLDFADCFVGSYRKVLDYKPGIFGPNQVFFRNEDAIYQSGDPEQLYREVLFSLKARVDLAYFPDADMRDDIMWIMHGILAVLGWSFLPRAGSSVVEEVEAWLRQSAERKTAWSRRPAARARPVP